MGLRHRDGPHGVAVIIDLAAPWPLKVGRFHHEPSFAKLHLQNRSQTVAYAHRQGLTTEDDDPAPSP